MPGNSLSNSPLAVTPVNAPHTAWPTSQGSSSIGRKGTLLAGTVKHVVVTSKKLFAAHRQKGSDASSFESSRSLASTDASRIRYLDDNEVRKASQLFDREVGTNLPAAIAPRVIMSLMYSLQCTELPTDAQLRSFMRATGCKDVVDHQQFLLVLDLCKEHFLKRPTPEDDIGGAVGQLFVGSTVTLQQLNKVAKDFQLEADSHFACLIKGGSSASPASSPSSSFIAPRRAPLGDEIIEIEALRSLFGSDERQLVRLFIALGAEDPDSPEAAHLPPTERTKTSFLGDAWYRLLQLPVARVRARAYRVGVTTELIDLYLYTVVPYGQEYLDFEQFSTLVTLCRTKQAHQQFQPAASANVQPTSPKHFSAAATELAASVTSFAVTTRTSNIIAAGCEPPRLPVEMMEGVPMEVSHNFVVFDGTDLNSSFSAEEHREVDFNIPTPTILKVTKPKRPSPYESISPRVTHHPQRITPKYEQEKALALTNAKHKNLPTVQKPATPPKHKRLVAIPHYTLPSIPTLVAASSMVKSEEQHSSSGGEMSPLAATLQSLNSVASASSLNTGPRSVNQMVRLFQRDDSYKAVTAAGYADVPSYQNYHANIAPQPPHRAAAAHTIYGDGSNRRVGHSKPPRHDFVLPNEPPRDDRLFVGQLMSVAPLPESVLALPPQKMSPRLTPGAKDVVQTQKEPAPRPNAETPPISFAELTRTAIVDPKFLGRGDVDEGSAPSTRKTVSHSPPQMLDVQPPALFERERRMSTQLQLTVNPNAVSPSSKQLVSVLGHDVAVPSPIMKQHPAMSPRTQRLAGMGPLVSGWVRDKDGMNNFIGMTELDARFHNEVMFAYCHELVFLRAAPI